MLPAPAVSLAMIFFGRKIHARFEAIQAMFSDISSRVQENLSGVRMIRAFVQEKAEMRRFEELNQQYIAQNIKLVRIQGVFQPLLEVLIGLTFLAVIWKGGHDVLLGSISMGSFVMFNTYMGILVWPMIALGWVVNLMQRGGASLNRINEILQRAAHYCPAREAPSRWRMPGGDRIPRRLGELRLRLCACDSVDLQIPAGATFAVVGHTGSGKSTLVNLVPRLFDPTEGAVTHRRRRPAPRSIRPNSGGSLGSCRRKPFSSAPPSPRTSRSEWTTPPTSRDSPSRRNRRA